MISLHPHQRIFMLHTDGIRHWYTFGTEAEQAQKLTRIQKLNPDKEIISFEIQHFSDRFVSQVFAGNLLADFEDVTEPEIRGGQNA